MKKTTFRLFEEEKEKLYRAASLAGDPVYVFINKSINRNCPLKERPAYNSRGINTPRIGLQIPDSLYKKVSEDIDHFNQDEIAGLTNLQHYVMSCLIADGVL